MTILTNLVTLKVAPQIKLFFKSTPKSDVSSTKIIITNTVTIKAAAKVKLSFNKSVSAFNCDKYCQLVILMKKN